MRKARHTTLEPPAPTCEFSSLFEFSVRSLSEKGENLLGFDVQSKQPVVYLKTVPFQIDAARFLDHLDMTMLDLDCLDDTFIPIDLDAGAVGIRW